MNTESNWKEVAQEVEEAFTDGSILKKERSTLEQWMAALTVGSHQWEKDQEKMLRRLDVIKHLVAVRLSEESEKRREAQSLESENEMRKHNRTTRYIALIGILMTAILKLIDVLWP